LSRPVPVPFRPYGVPFHVLRFIGRVLGGWGVMLAWWVLRYEMAESVCPLCGDPHTLSQCPRWRAQA